MSRPIFVVGFQRSGTTLLQGVLGAHPDVVAAPETHYFVRIHDLRDYYGDLCGDDRLRRVIRDLLEPPLPLFAGCGFDAERLFRRVRRREPTYAALLDELLTDLAERAGARRWSEKTPSQPVAQIVELFPDAQVVHIVRDVCDAVASALEAPWNDRDAATIAAQWARFERATRSTARRLPDDGYRCIRYEQLVRQPQATIAGLCQFLGLEPRVAEMMGTEARGRAVPAIAGDWLHRVGTPFDPDRVGRGARTLDAPTQRAVMAAVEHERRSGPPPATHAPPPGARERYEATQQFLRELARATGSARAADG